MNHQNRDIGREAETADALVWLRKIAERAAMNRSTSGLDATQLTRDVLAIKVERVAVAAEPVPIRQWPGERTAIEANSVPFLASVRSLQRVCASLAASIIAIVAFGGIASYRFFQLQRQDRATFSAALEHERQESSRARQDLIREVGP